jgi:hypothetical protein
MRKRHVCDWKRGEAVIRDYDIELVAGRSKGLSEAISDATKHALPDWLAHRISVLKADADGVARDIDKHRKELMNCSQTTK